ncbi:MAG: hypothetical protein AAGF89_14240 [Bacteroidota bacterium]
MRAIILFTITALLISCGNSIQDGEGKDPKHAGLRQLEVDAPFRVLYSDEHELAAMQQATLLKEAYGFLAGIMGPKDDFHLLVISEDDWATNAYSPVPGMPEYYRGNLIVGAGQNSMATGYGEMLTSLPPELTKGLYQTYADENGELDMKLFFDKLSVHELTHSFQDPENKEGYSMARWLEEVHANIGLYAFYKNMKPTKLKYLTALVDFSLAYPAPDLAYHSLADFDTYYYDMGPANYGHYQMKFTKAAQLITDSLGVAVLQPLNNFLIKYDDSWKAKMSAADFQQRLAAEVDPYLVTVMEELDGRGAPFGD